jgi:DNA adenine methylase
MRGPFSRTPHQLALRAWTSIPNTPLSRKPDRNASPGPGREPLKPVLRWAGSKRSLIPRLLTFFPQSFGRYIEPFAGSACVFFAISPSRAVLNDNNPGLIRFYRDIRDQPQEVYAAFRKIARDDRTYYRMRQVYNELPASFERSVLFYYLNRNCFNGIFRTNIRGEFNVPFADRRVAAYPTIDEVLSASRLLRRSRLICGDFETACLKHAEAGDFVYLDPPYYVPSKRTFREYSATPFSQVDFDRLTFLLSELNRREVLFVLSYPDCDLARALAKPWRFAGVRARRRVAGASASRGYAEELVIRNFM